MTQTMIDPNSVEYRVHHFYYEWNGRTWHLQLHAASKQEAIERLQALPHARYQGVLTVRADAPWWLKLRAWWRSEDIEQGA